ncbi:MAG TPA: hypothetical protein VK667_05645, partial [Ktedonobacteraceae bacterium]|nr:hypothetical protein [Ktedonobacteraceae bacterium]
THTVGVVGVVGVVEAHCTTTLDQTYRVLKQVGPGTAQKHELHPCKQKTLFMDMLSISSVIYPLSST